MKYLFLFLAIFFMYKAASAQPTRDACKELTNGIFYLYAKNSDDRYISIREGEWVHENNLVSGDTSLWKLKWLTECRYSLQLAATNMKFDEKTLDFFKKHKLLFEINSITDDYYTVTSYLDNIDTQPLSSDTLWFQEKKDFTPSKLFTRISNLASLRKDHFSDTSSYAVVYLYRPKKITHSLDNYYVYFNTDVCWAARNNSGIAFKVFKEGPVVFKSRLFKDEASVTIDIQFGKSYYIQSTTHWGIYKGGNNFKLEMTSIPAAEGKPAFDEVKYR